MTCHPIILRISFSALLLLRSQCCCPHQRPGRNFREGLTALPAALAGLPSVNQADPSNIAGLLQYCVQNNYLSSATAGAAQSGLLAKIPGAQQSSDYTAGSSGLLQTGNGKSFDLGSVTGDLKSQVASKVCDAVLQHAQSLL